MPPCEESQGEGTPGPPYIHVSLLPRKIRLRFPLQLVARAPLALIQREVCIII